MAFVFILTVFKMFGRGMCMRGCFPPILQTKTLCEILWWNHFSLPRFGFISILYTRKCRFSSVDFIFKSKLSHINTITIQCYFKRTINSIPVVIWRFWLQLYLWVSGLALCLPSCLLLFNISRKRVHVTPKTVSLSVPLQTKSSMRFLRVRYYVGED